MANGTGRSGVETTHSFLLRVWLEPRVGGDPVFRGRIEHVETRESAALASPAAIEPFVLRFLAPGWTPPSGPEKPGYYTGSKGR